MPEFTFWGRTKQASNTAYEKALKPGFDKAYNVVNKLEPHVNKFSHKVGSETFWPGELDKESEKAARILRSFCKDGVYEHIDEEAAQKLEKEEGQVPTAVPNDKQRVIMKIPASVIQKAKGLCIFTSMRYGWVIGGSGGAGVLVGRHPETGEWSPPSGIHMSNISFGFLIGADLLDTVLVINTFEALEAFTKLRCTLGTEVGVAAGPLGIGGMLETSVNKKPAPVWSYVKSRGLYGGVSVDGNIIIERTDENARFYDEEGIVVAKILRGEVRRPPTEKYKVLLDTIKAAEGQNVDESLLPEGAAPSDMELVPEGPMFGIPDEDDPDPFGVKALEAQGLSIREAGTHRKATPESFEFKPSPTSPVYSTYRKSMDTSMKRKEWRGSTISISSMDRGTQTAGDENSPARTESPPQYSETIRTPPPLPDRKKPESIASDKKVDELNPVEEKPVEEDILDKVNGVTENSPSKNIALDESKMSSEPQHDVKIILPPEEVVVQENTDTRISTESSTNEDVPVEKDNKDIDHDEKEDSEDNTDDEDDFSDFESDVEIITAVPVTARPKAGVVTIPQRIAPALPARNPGRLSRSPMTEDPPMINGFEQVSLNGDEQEHDRRQSEDATKTDGKTSESTAKVALTPGAFQADDEFHSMPSSPQDEKQQNALSVPPVK